MGTVQVVVDMVVDRLQQEDAQTHGWLLDGYPRSGEQAKAIEAAGIRPDVFILVNVTPPPSFTPPPPSRDPTVFVSYFSGRWC